MPVVVEDLVDGMRRHHVLGDKRRRALRDGGCSSRTDAEKDRMQHVGFSGAAPGAADQADCMDLEGLAAVCGSSCRVCKMKEHRSRDCEELFSRGLHSELLAGCEQFTGKVPRSGVGECARAVFLRDPTSGGVDPL